MRLWLKKLREDKGLTKQAVADYLGISQNYYHYIETGERQKDLGLSFIDNIAKLFDVTAEWIIEQESQIKSA